jgi:hypothetical protein
MTDNEPCSFPLNIDVIDSYIRNAKINQNLPKSEKYLPASKKYLTPLQIKKFHVLFNLFIC